LLALICASWNVMTAVLPTLWPLRVNAWQTPNANYRNTLAADNSPA
jgi:hypothetical protein